MSTVPLHLFLDLDLTLVNVFPLWKDLWIREIAERLSLSPNVVYARGAMIWERGDLYTLEGHLRALDIDPMQTAWAKNLQTQFEEKLREGATNYDDTSEFLDCLEQHGIARSILTFGDRSYQQLKIDGLKRAAGFFQECHFTSSYGEKSFRLHEAERLAQVVFLDDSPSEHARVAVRARTVHRIQIRRSDDIPRSEFAHHVVTDLAQALEVILSLTRKQPEESR